MQLMDMAIARSIGLDYHRTFFRDRQFRLALYGLPLLLMAFAPLLSEFAPAEPDLKRDLPLLFALLIWQPLTEELLFRGIIQGGLHRFPLMRARMAGFTLANFAASVLFAAAHLVNHSIAWSAAVILPSLIFGHFRDRHYQIYPCMLLHAVYNACYLMLFTT